MFLREKYEIFPNGWRINNLLEVPIAERYKTYEKFRKDYYMVSVVERHFLLRLRRPKDVLKVWGYSVLRVIKYVFLWSSNQTHEGAQLAIYSGYSSNLRDSL